MAYWQKTHDAPDGEVLKTDTLVLIVNSREGGGWEARVCNAGRYKSLRIWPHPLTGHINDAKRAALSMARDVLRKERVEIEGAEVE